MLIPKKTKVDIGNPIENRVTKMEKLRKSGINIRHYIKENIK